MFLKYCAFLCLERKVHMSEQNKLSIEFFKEKARFADLMNGFGNHGKQLILPEYILELDPVIPMMGGQGAVLRADVNIVDLMRKVQMRCQAVLVALQNRTEIHYAMPVRVMNTDAANYYKQWKELQNFHRTRKDLTGSAEFLSGMKKEDRLNPVLTMVVYFGQEPWHGPRRLKDILDLSGLCEDMQGMIADYPMNLLEVRSFKNLEWFRSDIRQVFGFLKYAQDTEQLKKFLKENEAEFRTMAGDAYDLIRVMSNTKELKQLKPRMQKEGGKYDMCKAIDDMILEGKEAGRQAGLEAGRNSVNLLIQKLMQDNRQEELLRSAKDPAFQMKLLKEYSLEK